MAKRSTDDDNADATINIVIDTGDALNNLALGQVAIRFTSTDTDIEHDHTYRWDVLATWPAGPETSPIIFPSPSGELNIVPVVNRPATP
jgi:hypothetical protein